MTTDDWIQPAAARVLPVALLKTLNTRRNLPGVLFFCGHLAATVLSGYLLFKAQEPLWIGLAALLHGLVLVYWFQPFHECAHRTAFKSRALNSAVYGFSGLIAVVEPTFFYHEHMQHHRYTQHPDRDPERIPAADTRQGYVAYLTGLPYFFYQWSALLRHACGHFYAYERAFLPVSAMSTVRREARLFLALYALCAIVATPAHLITYWLLPRLLGEPFMRMVRLSEHQGTPLVPDLLRNTRTVVAWFPLRLLGWQACFHAEHHLSPNTPFHAVHRLHRALAGQLEHVSPGYLAAHQGIAGDAWAGRLPRGGEQDPADRQAP